MGRPKRIQFAGACYYIVLKGNNRQDIFVSGQDRRQFLSLLRLSKEHYGLKVYAYCLLDQQAHLLLETLQANLSAVMQGFNTKYTKYFNAQHNTVGHVFQGRFKSFVVDKAAYLGEVSRHIHLGPVRQGLKDKPWRYLWSSCRAFVESEESDSLVDSEEVLARFGKIRLKQSVRYLQYIKDRMKSAGDSSLPISAGVIGGEEFLQALKIQKPPCAAEPSQAQQARKIVSEISSRHGIGEERLLGRMQWREISALRRKAIYRIWKETRIGVTELARLFNRTPSAISQVIRAMELGIGR